MNDQRITDAEVDAWFESARAEFAKNTRHMRLRGHSPIVMLTYVYERTPDHMTIGMQLSGAVAPGNVRKVYRGLLKATDEAIRKGTIEERETAS